MERDEILNELQAMKQRMDALYSESTRGHGAAQRAGSSELQAWQPPIDIWETSTEWVLEADLPGLSETDLKVEVLEDKLLIEGRRETVPSAKGITVSQIERPAGRFSRAFVLPGHTRADAIEAELKRGVLRITIPKDRTGGGEVHRVRIKAE